MKKQSFRLLSQPCIEDCPAIIESGEDIIVIGSMLTEAEENAMKEGADVGVAAHERTVRIPRAVFEAAVDKLLTEKV